jgi:glycosyltransferase involved in cell wall biosynthesis
MRVLYIGSHSILEYDEVRLLSSLGHDVFSIGAYTDPANPSDDKRPPISGLEYHADLDALCRRQRERHAGEDLRFYIDYAKSDLAPELIDWAEVIIFAAFPEAWIVPQWKKQLAHKRVIWRTIGQSDTSVEQYVARCEGLEIVRYSPREKVAFEKLGAFAGEDAMIRFAKDPADWYGWTGEDALVGNITQDMAGRGEACGYSFWLAATEGLSARPAGPNSEALPGGVGTLEYDAMREYLRRISAYLYTGTQPASYTLGLIEAMMTGVPIVVMDPARVGYPPLYEAAEIMRTFADVDAARQQLTMYLAHPDHYASKWARTRAIELFSTEVIAPQWGAFLGAAVAVAA